MKFLQKNQNDIIFGNHFFKFYDQISLLVSDYFYEAHKKCLIRKSLRIYTKYNTYLYNLSKQRTLLFLMRHFLQITPIYYNILPFFQFLKQVHLRDTIFYGSVEEIPQSVFFTLPKKIFLHSKFKKFFLVDYNNDLCGGTNFFFLDSTIFQKPYDLKHFPVSNINLSKDCAILKSFEKKYFLKHSINLNSPAFILYLLFFKNYYCYFVYQVLKNLNNKYI